MSSKTIMIPSKIRRDGVKGRFDPSEPLHMTTRHAAARVRVNSDPSINGSYEDDDDLQPSFDQVRPTTSRSLGSPTSAKGRRISGSSTNNSLPDGAPSYEEPSSEKKRRRSSPRPLSPVNQHIPPVRKRKRSSPTPQPDIPHGSGNIVTPPSNTVIYPYNGQFIEVVPPEDLSDREFGGSSPSGSDAQMTGGYLGITESTEFTPAASEAVSPASEDSDPENPFPAKDLIKTAFPQIEINDADDADDIDDLGDADDVDDADDGDDVDEGDDQARVYGEGFTRRRFAGRRRADHPVPEIEATMRRQLALKSMYRSISRSLKPVLAEIAYKTIEELKANPTKHEEVVEYQGTDDEAGIQELLNQALERRKHQINAQLKWNRQLLKDSHAAEVNVRVSNCRLQIEESRDQLFDRLEHEMLVIARKAQLSDDNASYETEDEDEVVPRPKGMGYRFTRKPALDPIYDSRSRPALEAERATADLHARYEMTKMLREFEDSEELERTRGFTVMDPRARNAAIARSTSIRSTNTLADAAAEVEFLANKPIIPVIPNAEALALQVLSDLATRPPIPGPQQAFDVKSIGLDNSISIKPETQMPPPLPPPPTVRRSAVFDIINLLHQSTPSQLNSQRPPYIPPGRPSSSPRRSSVPGPVSQEHGLLSPTSNLGGAPTFPSPSAMSATYGAPQQPQQLVSPSHHSRTVSLEAPSRIVHHQFPPTGADGSQWPQGQPSPGRNAASSQRTSQLFSRDGPLRIERVNPAESQERRPPPFEDRFNDNSPSSQLLGRPLTQSHPQPQPQPQPQWEAPSSIEPGSTDSRSQQVASPHGYAKDANVSTPAFQQRSRASSTKSLSANRDFTPDASSATETAHYHKRQQAESTIKFSSKLSKDQRSGRSRKDHKSLQRASQGSPAVETNNKPPIIKYALNSNPPVPDNGGSMGRFRLSKAMESTPWSTSSTPGPPHAGQPGGQYTPQNVYPHPPQHQQRHIPPPLPGFQSPFFGDPPHHPQRSSLPGQGQQAWQLGPPNPQVYGMPQAGHPPGFPPPEHWQSQQQQQQQQHYGPLNPARGPLGMMQPAAPPATPQYGGTTLAPATGPQSGSLHSNAGSGNHLPAFAQRGTQESSSRKRAQSDAPKVEFRAYVHKEKPAR